MRRLKVVEEFRADSEEEAIEALAVARSLQAEHKYTLGTNGYKYKTKKSKGEIIDQAWIVTTTKIFGEVWEDG